MFLLLAFLYLMNLYNLNILICLFLEKLQLCREERSRLIREGTQLKGIKVESNTQSGKMQII